MTDSHDENVARILRHAETQSPLLDKETAMSREFFAAMATVWRVADEYDMTKDLPFTKFLLFGPQTVGKTTIVERILGFPVAVVKQGVGTTRPMVLTTRRGEREEFHVKASDDATFTGIKKEKIVTWVTEQMEATKGTISDKHIHIQVSGPAYMNRRFVDLPGFQTNSKKDENGASDGNRKAILDLLVKELESPDTVVVCVDKAGEEVETSSLVTALDQIFEGNFVDQPNLARRFVLAINQSDKWIGAGGVTEMTFVQRVCDYLITIGLLPIFVGASVDAEKKELLDARADRKPFDFKDVVEMYAGANNREHQLYQDFHSRISLDNDRLKDCLKTKLLGFNTLLKTVDTMVIDRDREKAEQIAQKLSQKYDVTMQEVGEIENKRQLLLGTNGNTLLSEAKQVHHTLLNYIHQIATDTPGKDFNAAETVAASVDWIKNNGNDALMEELEFAFGSHARNSLKAPVSSQGATFQGYYNPELPYKVSGIVVPELLESTKVNFHMQVRETIRAVEQAKSAEIECLSYLNTPLIGGQLYDRAFSVWSSLAYRLVAPSKDDLISLANTVGIDPEMCSPDRQDFKKAKRLAGIYIERLIPAIHYLCQKMEFLLLKNFEAAWMVLLRTNKAFVEAIGHDEFKHQVKTDFKNAISKRAEMAFGKCVYDLRNEVHKLVPYADSGPSVTGMLLAYPGDPTVAQSILQTTAKYHEIVKEKFKDIIPSSFKSSLLQGVEYGLELLAACSGIDPLLFGGLHLVAKILVKAGVHLIVKKSQARNSGQGEVLADDRDMRLLGVSACLYSHFLPRFIVTIESRMRSDFWASLGDVKFKQELEEAFSMSTVIKDAAENANKLNKLKHQLLEKAKKISAAQTELDEISSKFPPSPVASQFAGSYRKKDHGYSYSNDEINDNGGPKDGAAEARHDQDMSICEEEFDCAEVADAIRRSTQYDSHSFDYNNDSATGSSVGDNSNEENVSPATSNKRNKRLGFGRKK